MLTDPQEPLHRRLLDLAIETIATSGVHALSLRDIARRAGVSHAAPIHHFGTKAGLLTELACEGFERLIDALDHAGEDLYDLGVAYVEWGVANPGLYDVMWRSDVVEAKSERLAVARQSAWARLIHGPESGPGRADAMAAFALVHGIVDLTLSGSQPTPPLDEPSLRAILRRFSPVPPADGAVDDG